MAWSLRWFAGTGCAALKAPEWGAKCKPRCDWLLHRSSLLQRVGKTRGTAKCYLLTHEGMWLALLVAKWCGYEKVGVSEQACIYGCTPSVTQGLFGRGPEADTCLDEAGDRGGLKCQSVPAWHSECKTRLTRTICARSQGRNLIGRNKTQVGTVLGALPRWHFQDDRRTGHAGVRTRRVRATA